jgi:hypothetical protein
MDERDRSCYSIVLHAQQSYTTSEVKFFLFQERILQKPKKICPFIGCNDDLPSVFRRNRYVNFERTTYAPINTSDASRSINNVGCFKTCCTILYSVIKHLIFYSKLLTIPKKTIQVNNGLYKWFNQKEFRLTFTSYVHKSNNLVYST